MRLNPCQSILKVEKEEQKLLIPEAHDDKEKERGNSLIQKTLPSILLTFR
jgi:hypothetical protein